MKELFFIWNFKEFGPSTDWNTLKRKQGEATQVRKCGSKIVLKRQHLLQIEMQWRESLAKQLR
jgi:hypothetical protein